jgi:hypothetical protein
METVNQLTPENKLMTLIDDALFSGNDHEDWQGTANQLSKDLCEGPYKHDARALLNWTNATGTYLGRLGGEATRSGCIYVQRAGKSASGGGWWHRSIAGGASRIG